MQILYTKCYNWPTAAVFCFLFLFLFVCLFVCLFFQCKLSVKATVCVFKTNRVFHVGCNF